MVSFIVTSGHFTNELMMNFC